MKLIPLNDKKIQEITSDQMDSFYELVVSDAKGKSSNEVLEYLHQHPNLWHYSLVSIRRDIELQLSCQKSKVQMHKNNLKANQSQYTESDVINYINKQENWRMTAIKFLSNVEKKLIYVKLLMKS